MKKVILYFKEAYDELVNKVTWPTWQELQGSAVIVMIASVIIALMIFVMDSSFSWILEKYYQTFSN